jgi:hypothetical protein
VAKDNNEKGKQSEANRLSALARAYRKDADGKDISKIGGPVTAIGQSPAVIERAREAAAARAAAQAAAIKSEKKWAKVVGGDKTETGGKVVVLAVL